MAVLGPDAPPAAGAGAADAVAALFRLHRLDLLRLAMFLTDDRGLAEDLVQDAFAGLQRRWDSLREPAAAIGYLRVSIVNAARSSRRRQGLARRHLWMVEPETTPSADYALLLEEEHRAVIAAMRQLPHRQREVLVLRYWLELSEADIAATLGISRGTVKSSAARGLDALQHRLEELA